ncbi:MAG: NUDIX domain-containing protein [Parcubacteria group bacterium]|nr:NUDIX domain-containing protein [Parcubacteria group bacterium]
MDTLQSVSKVLDSSICDSFETFNDYKQRITEGSPTRDENPKSHFCAYFLPYNSQNKKVFFIHHKKSGLWLSPGGHVDKGEILLEALNREIYEELGVKNLFKEEQSPFLLTITPIENKVQPCKVHYDVWFLVHTDGGNFNVDPVEFHDAKWLTIEEARKIVTDQANLKALEIIEIL